MKRNIVLFVVSLFVWSILVYVFDNKLIWSILFVAFIVALIGFLIKLHLHMKIKTIYKVKYNIEIKEFIATVYYFLPLIVVFTVCTILHGKSEIVIPSIQQFIITVVIGGWISWMESVLITNSFVKQTIDALSE